MLVLLGISLPSFGKELWGHWFFCESFNSFQRKSWVDWIWKVTRTDHVKLCIVTSTSISGEYHYIFKLQIYFWAHLGLNFVLLHFCFFLEFTIHFWIIKFLKKVEPIWIKYISNVRKSVRVFFPHFCFYEDFSGKGLYPCHQILKGVWDRKKKGSLVENPPARLWQRVTAACRLTGKAHWVSGGNVA